MTSQSRSTLKTYFNAGDQPTEAQFADLIDSAVNVVEDFSAETYADAVFVDSAGSDVTGKKGRVDRPFLTIDAALDELGAGGGAVYIGVGTFPPVTRAKIKDYTKFFGSGKPQSIGNSHLEGGTVIQGPLASFSSYVEFHDLGVDSGSNVCTALYAGVAQDGLSVNNLIPSLAEVVTGIVVSNVSAICQSDNAAVHCVLIESATDVTVSNITTTFGTHGVALKATFASLSNIRSYGSANDNMIIKSDPTSVCHDVTVTGLQMGAVAGDAGGLILASHHPDGLYNITVTGATATNTSYGVTFQHTDGIFGHINVDMEIISPLYGTVNLNSLPFPDSVFINGSPVVVQQVDSSGNPYFENGWTSLSASNEPASYYKANGRVYLAGHAVMTSVSPPALGTTIFTLPVGYRPAAVCRWPVVSNGTHASINVAPTGTVAYEIGDATGWIGLAGSFWVGP